MKNLHASVFVIESKAFCSSKLLLLKTFFSVWKLAEIRANHPYRYNNGQNSIDNPCQCPLTKCAQAKTMYYQLFKERIYREGSNVAMIIIIKVLTH